jgi:ABC-type multidrug transport system ATPase subunit
MTLAEQRVVALVEALTAPEVAVVVLEDPFFELDATDRVRVTTAVRRKAERGGCVFLSTDSARLALEVADTFLLLQEGVVQAQGPLSDLGRVGQPVGLRIAATPLRALAAALAAEPQVDSLWLQEDALEVWGNSSREVASAVARAAVHAAAEILAMEPLLGSLWDETGPDDPHGDRQDALAAASPKFNDGKALP